MDLNPGTNIDDLLKVYSFLMNLFLEKSPKFKHLANPIMRKTIGKVATLNQVVTIGKLDMGTLLDDLAQAIRENTTTGSQGVTHFSTAVRSSHLGISGSFPTSSALSWGSCRLLFLFTTYPRLKAVKIKENESV